ncbi:MAG: ABC transporter permease [Firmicutes bacterium]|jgi:peptide/nickel transport system permease protein|nr:ABC transporter permease [Bacillota bacterium]
MKYILQRLGFYIAAAFVALVINFAIPHLMPGNPVEAALVKLTQGGGTVTPQTICAIAKQTSTYIPHCGVQKVSIMSQFWHYVVNLAHGNLGYSTSKNLTVDAVIVQVMPWTLLLVGFSTLIAFVLGTVIGIIAAWRRGSMLDSSLPVLSFFQGIPYFILALLLQYFFTVKWQFLPIGQGESSNVVQGWNWPFIASALEHSILPAVTLVLASMAGWSVGMRNVMITTVSEEYVLAAQAKGLSNWRIVTTYAARNAILPNIAGLANALGLVVSGVIIMEVVFSYPGAGNMMFNAVSQDDYSLVSGLFLCISAAVLLANFIADGIYVILDPRIRKRAAY